VNVILRLHNLTKEFGGLTAVNNVSLEFREEEINAIIGPNGAGKTTILNVITGIYPATSGNVYFQDNEISGLKPFHIAYLGITRTFQHVQIFPNMTVLENVMVGFHPKTKSEFASCLLNLPRVKREEQYVHARAYEVLEFATLADKANSSSSGLAFGEQKRLEIARALAGDPKVILLDEPVAGLNLKETDEVSKFIMKIREKGTTIILVEHNMHLVMGISDKISVLNYGKKIAEGIPSDIQENENVIRAYLGG
jgi:branched-chain amino acid transport system ATP-binding protein